MYEPNGSQSTMSTSQSSMSAVSVVSDRKFIVFDCQLDKLLCHLVCPICQCPCSMDDVVKKYNDGTLLHVVAHCIEGHIIVDWQSQPLIGRMPAGNLLFCAATLQRTDICTYAKCGHIPELTVLVAYTVL